MFKSWRSDKKKIKIVFQLQFQVTQVPKLKKPALTISLVPDDVGKPTLKLEKVSVQDGTCLWENPVYETVKLIKEMKTGKLSEKIYHFVVATGSSKSGFLGEASVDFADFAAETGPVVVSLPLKFANSGAVLHVTIHKLEGGLDQRYLEENEILELNEDGSIRSVDSNLSIHENNLSFSEDRYSKNAEQNGNGNQDHDSILSILRQNSMPRVDSVSGRKQTHRRSNTDWSVSSASDGSLLESANSPEDNPRERREISDNSIEKLRSENAILLRQAELSELELQSLKKVVTKESKRTQDLSRQVSSLKEVKESLRKELEQLRLQKNTDAGHEDEDAKIVLEEMRQELDHEKDLNANLRLQLQKTQDSNSNLVLAVRDLNEMLEQKNSEIACLSSKTEANMRMEEERAVNSECHTNSSEDQNLKLLAREQIDTNELDLLKQTITDLNAELEFYRKHKEELEMHIDKLSQKYEAVKKENCNLLQNDLMKAKSEQAESLATIEELESQIQRLEDKIKQQSEEYSESLIAINELESQVKELKKELEIQTQVYENNLDAMMHAKTEQEQRAIQAEENLRKTRWENAAAAEQLQEEFKKLSLEMGTKLSENENLAMKTAAENDKLRKQKLTLEEKLQKVNEELGIVREQNEAKLRELMDKLDLKAKQIENMSMELDNRTKQLECAQQHGEEEHEAFSKEVQLLKTEIEKLKGDEHIFHDQKEVNSKITNGKEQKKISSQEKETLMEGWRKEKDELEKRIASAKKDSRKAKEQLITMRSLKEEKETRVMNLQSEVEELRLKHNDLRDNLVKEKKEKEKLKKQIFQLEDGLRKTENSTETQSRNKSGQATCADVNMTVRSVRTSVQNDSEHITTLRNILRTLKEQMKLKESAIADSASSDTEVGMNLSRIIEELKHSVGQLKDCQCPAYCCQKGENSGEERLHSKTTNLKGNPASKKVNRAAVERNGGIGAEKEMKLSTSKASNEASFRELQTEVVHLKERNQSMERELKDMQERYSEISLKFAEVEGERQQLVMAVRNLKNGKKN